MKKIALIVVVAGLIAASWFWRQRFTTTTTSTLPTGTDVGEVVRDTVSQIHPLSIASLRQTPWNTEPLTIVEELSRKSTHRQFLASYQSEGNTIYGLLLIPLGTKPEGGWPIIVFNHGYIPPDEYRTTERYVAYQDAFARNGYVVFKSDYRGHGDSEGQAQGGYGSNAYTIDVINGMKAVQQHPDVNRERIGYWGHSMGGHITLRAMVVMPEIQAGVIWAGVVAPYQDLLTRWRRMVSVTPSIPPQARRWRDELVNSFGTPEDNPQFWDSLSAHTYLEDISGPVQLHHGTADTSVPVEFSQNLELQMQEKNLPVELFIYQGDDHNISGQFSTAMQRSVDFFDQELL